jgi:hypothetical protein
MRRGKVIHFVDQYTGWFGEGCWRSHGRRFIKRLEHRHNRRVLNLATRKETQYDERQDTH